MSHQNFQGILQIPPRMRRAGSAACTPANCVRWSVASSPSKKAMPISFALFSIIAATLFDDRPDASGGGPSCSSTSSSKDTCSVGRCQLMAGCIPNRCCSSLCKVMKYERPLCQKTCLGMYTEGMAQYRPTAKQAKHAPSHGSSERTFRTSPACETIPSLECNF